MCKYQHMNEYASADVDQLSCETFTVKDDQQKLIIPTCASSM